MTPIQKTLLAIALFILLVLGSFIWFVSQWASTHSQKAQNLLTQTTTAEGAI